MDPNANLQEQERILTSGQKNGRLAELRNALTQWLSKGGFEPDWTLAPHAAKYFGE